MFFTLPSVDIGSGLCSWLMVYLCASKCQQKSTLQKFTKYFWVSVRKSTYNSASCTGHTADLWLFSVFGEGEGSAFKSRLQYSKQKRHGLKWLCWWCNVVLQSFPRPCGRDHHTCSSPASRFITWIFQFWAGGIRRLLLGWGEIRGWVFLQLQYPSVYGETE